MESNSESDTDSELDFEVSHIKMISIILIIDRLW